jgi:2-polyprenyl-6-methoxyphenol hydroxylase-like FAD-dependent oxidoreductase
MKVVILGTGTAGLTTALILKTVKPLLDVEVIGSPNIGIVGVGESSTEHFKDLRDLLGLSTVDILRGCHATYKFGVYFEGWREEGKDYIHSISSKIIENSVVSDKLDQNILLEGFMAYNYDPMEMVDKSTIEPEMRVCMEDQPNQYHFDTFKLNEFLRHHCAKRSIKIHEDDVTPIFKDDGSCDGLVGNAGMYRGDMYVDASGFNKAIVGAMPEFEWRKNDDLFVDTALAFQCEHPENYRCYTTAKRMKNGWMWRIPTYTRMGNGYAFNSEFCTEDEALDEVESVLGFRPEKYRKFSFEAGSMKTFWNKNVVAIGLSSHFFEPIEATAIGVGIQQAMLLSKYIGFDGEEVKDTYNDQITEMINQVATYIELHYKNVPDDTPFWEMVKGKIDLLPSKNLDRILEIMHNRQVTDDDVGGDTKINLFGQHNFNQVAYGLGILKPETVEKHFVLKNGESIFQAMLRPIEKREARNMNNPRHIDFINAINESEE